MSQALYRKYRSRSLSEVLGQDHITDLLENALKKNKVSHAYLLTGPRGTGKTSIARILAHEINGLDYSKNSTHLDIIEIDAASNNSVDDIRDLREKAQIAPVEAKKKIYIIDEVHMLSRSAFNALLKTLEEPPEHIVFIMATTDADKLPSTILSRVQQLHFHPISTNTISEHLEFIAKSEGFEIEPGAAKLIASHSRGGFRDAISLLDQLSALVSEGETLKSSQVEKQLGLNAEQIIDELINSWRENNHQKSLKILSEIESLGSSPIVLTRQILDRLRQNLHENPDDSKLMRELIEVANHPHPDLKLLTIFAPKSSESQPQNTQTAEPQKPSSAPPTKQPASESISNSPEKTQKKSATKPDPDKTPKDQDSKPETRPTKNPKTPQTKESETPEKSAPKISELDWDTLLKSVKGESPGLAGILTNCTHEIDGGTLKIYAGTSFKKNKIESPKFMPILHKCVELSVGHSAKILITDKQQPPKNKEFAKVAAIMGGGEEINLEELR